jgi:hypothetical protein
VDVGRSSKFLPHGLNTGKGIHKIIVTSIKALDQMAAMPADHDREDLSAVTGRGGGRMISFVKTEGAAVAGSALCGADLYYLAGAFIYLTRNVMLGYLSKLVATPWWRA